MQDTVWWSGYFSSYRHNWRDANLPSGSADIIIIGIQLMAHTQLYQIIEQSM